MEDRGINMLGQMDNTIDHTFESANRVYGSDGIAPTLPTSCGGGHTPKICECEVIGGSYNYLEKKVLTGEEGEDRCLRAEQSRAEQSRAEQSSLVYVRQATKSGYIPCEVPGIADLTFPDSQTRRGRVQGNGQICPTLTTENIPNVLEEWLWRLDERGIYEEKCRKILQVLWQKDGEKDFCEWAIRGLWIVLEKEILQQNMYAQGIYKNWESRPDLFKFSYHSKGDQRTFYEEGFLRDLWQDWKARCPSYGWELEQQHREQFESVMQELSYEGTQAQSFVQSMWQTYEGTGVLQQALSEIQEIWTSDGSEEAEWYCIRIRKLTPRCCWRLMGFSDEDFDKAAEVNSSTQLYKEAGNSIVVDVLENIFKELIK